MITVIIFIIIVIVIIYSVLHVITISSVAITIYEAFSWTMSRYLLTITCALNCSSFRLLHFSQSTTMWDDLIENLWRHVVAVGVVFVAVVVGFSRLVHVYSTCEISKTVNQF